MEHSNLGEQQPEIARQQHNQHPRNNGGTNGSQIVRYQQQHENTGRQIQQARRQSARNNYFQYNYYCNNYYSVINSLNNNINGPQFYNGRLIVRHQLQRRHVAVENSSRHKTSKFYNRIFFNLKHC